VFKIIVNANGTIKIASVDGPLACLLYYALIPFRLILPTHF
jgi:hypothetical protein